MRSLGFIVFFLISSVIFAGCGTTVPKPVSVVETKQGLAQGATRVPADPEAIALFHFIRGVQGELAAGMSKTEEEALKELRLSAKQFEEVVKLGQASLMVRSILARELRELAEREPTEEGRNELFQRVLEQYEAILASESAPPQILEGYLAILREVFRKSPEELLRALEAMVQKNPNGFLLQSRLAEFYSQMGRLEDALKMWQKLTEKWPKKENFWLARGETELALREHDKALRSLEQARALSTEQEFKWDVMRQEAICYLEIGEQGKASVLLRELVERQPQEADNWVYWGEFLSGEQRYPDAEQAVRRALSLERRHFYGNVVLGRVLLAQGKAPDALEVYERLARMWPRRPEAWRVLGQAQMGQGLYGPASESFSTAVHLAPSSTDTRFSLAEAYRLGGQFQSAESLLKDLMVEFPGNVAVLRALYFLYVDAEIYPVAYSLALQIHAIEPSYLSVYMQGSVLERLGRLDEAVVFLKKSILLKPDFSAAWNYLGYALIEQGIHLDGAQAFIENALLLDPGNGAYLDSLGWAYYQQGKYKEALRYLKEAVDSLKRPGDSEPVIFEHLGDAFAKLGCFEEASSAWGEALLGEKDPARQSLIQAKMRQAPKSRASRSPCASPKLSLRRQSR